MKACEPFESVSGRAFTDREAIEHSLNKHRRLLEMLVARKLPEWFGPEHVASDFCACCSKWMDKDLSGCPLSVCKFCQGTCCEEWSTIEWALIKWDFSVFRSVIKTNPDFPAAEAACRGIITRLEDALKGLTPELRECPNCGSGNLYQIGFCACYKPKEQNCADCANFEARK